MVMLPPDTMLLTPLVLFTLPRGLLMLRLIPSMDRDMPMDIMAMVCGRGDSSNSLVTLWTGCSILSVLSGAQSWTAGQNA